MENVKEEVKKLLEKEWFWLDSFCTTSNDNKGHTLTKENLEHNQNMAEDLKNKLEQKYPSISVDTEQIMNIGMRYTQYKINEALTINLEKAIKKHEEEMKKNPAGEDVGINNQFLKESQRIKRDYVKSPIGEIEIIVAASKITPENCSNEDLEYLRSNGWKGRFINPLLERLYTMYCQEKESASKIQRLEEENSRLQQENLKLRKLLSKAAKFFKQVKNSKVGNIFFKKQINKLSTIPDKEKDDNVK